MPFSLIPFLLLIVPIVEIATFIFVGGRIGIFATLGLILLTAVMGSILLRFQGFAVLSRIRAEIEANRLPGRELGNGAMILSAGILLLTPGFVTDSIGFALFVPAVREALWRFLARRIQVIRVSPAGPADTGRRREDVIDLEHGEYSAKPNPDTPWRDRPSENGAGTSSGAGNPTRRGE